MAIDVSHMGRAALEAATADSYAKAKSLIDDARKKTSTGEDLYAYLGDDKERVKGYLADCDIMEAALAHADEVDGMESRIKNAFSSTPRVSGMPDLYQTQSGNGFTTFGDAFIKSARYQELSKATDGFRHNDDLRGVADFLQFSVDESPLRSGRKALITSGSAVGGPFVTPYYDLQYEPSARPLPAFTDLVSRVQIDTDSVNWIQQTTRSTSATSVSESTSSTGTTGTKPEATIALARKTSPVETIAVTAAVTERELADAGQMRAVIDEDLRADILLQLDAQVLTGNGTSPNLTGILNAGIQTVGCSTAIGNVIDCMLRAQIVIMTANEPAPDATVLNPLDWEPMRILKSTGSGEYIWGAPGEPLMGTLWGLPLLVSNQLTENTGLVGAFKRACRLYDRDQVRVVVGWINDDLYRNIVRVRMEMRAAFAVRRPNAICRVTGI